LNLIPRGNLADGSRAASTPINRHYKYVAKRLTLEDVAPRSYIPRPKTEVVTHPAVVVVGQLNRGTLEALEYARSIADEIDCGSCRYWYNRPRQAATAMGTA
jgi:hypothetical protein